MFSDNQQQQQQKFLHIVGSGNSWFNHNSIFNQFHVIHNDYDDDDDDYYDHDM